MVTYTDKAYLRRHMSRLRGSQAPGLARGRSIEAQRRLLASDIWARARVVALYNARKEEMGTQLLMARALAEGKELYLPRVVRGVAGAMEFVRLTALTGLVRSPLGIMEPPAGLPGAARFEDFRPQLVVVPGVAFDVAGCRLGFGGGYYDRFLAGADCDAVGLCFAFQVVAGVPHDAWDVHMTHLCTEERLVALR